MNRFSGEQKLCGTMASTINPTAPYLFNARNSRDATELLPHSTKSKTVLEREDQIPSNKHSVITSFTILQKMYVLLPLSAFQTLIVLQRRRIRDACCCPAFLIGIAGPFLIISGAVFADRFISQHLTEYYFLGGTPHLNSRLYEIARVLKTLKLCLNELKTFYGKLLPPAPTLLPSGGRNQSMNPRSLPGTPSRKIQGPSLFPHFCRFTANGKDFELKYVTRLVPHHSEKAVFKATLQQDGQTHPVVVKFTPTYCARAHEVAFEMGSAPKLWFCEVAESVGMFVVVMDFVEGRRVDNDKPRLPKEVLGPLQSTISALHNAKLVHGDLRGPNVIVSEGKGGKRTMLLDFDWAGEEGEVFYPADINMQLTWHGDVKPGALIKREHDIFMLECWASAWKTAT
jgi:hypothetical protein